MKPQLTRYQAKSTINFFYKLKLSNYHVFENGTISDMCDTNGKFLQTLTVYGHVFTTKSFKIWHNMLSRCSSSNQYKSNCYANATICEEWQDFSVFAKWCNEQASYHCQDFELDSDLYMQGAKHYSPDTCLFIPSELNLFIMARSPKENGLPCAVYQVPSGKYTARYASKHLGTFSTPEAASVAHAVAKVARLEELLMEYAPWLDESVRSDLRAYV